MATSKGAIWGGFVAALGVVAGIAGLITFTSGKNLPDFFPSPSQSAAAPNAPASSAAQPGAEPTANVAEPTMPTISAIRLPSDVFEYRTFMNETRQSHTLDSSQIGSGVYVYGYWEDPESIWLDATVTSGDEGLAAVSAVQDQVSATAQFVRQDRAVTCAWIPDSDPNTPRHGVQCFRIDAARGIAMVTETHTSMVGEVGPSNLANEIWANMSIS